MYGSMVDTQSATAEWGEEKRKKPQGKNIMSASAMQGGHNDTRDDRVAVASAGPYANHLHLIRNRSAPERSTGYWLMVYVPLDTK